MTNISGQHIPKSSGHQKKRSRRRMTIMTDWVTTVQTTGNDLRAKTAWNPSENLAYMIKHKSYDINYQIRIYFYNAYCLELRFIGVWDLIIYDVLYYQILLLWIIFHIMIYFIIKNSNILVHMSLYISDPYRENVGDQSTQFTVWYITQETNDYTVLYMYMLVMWTEYIKYYDKMRFCI